MNLLVFAGPVVVLLSRGARAVATPHTVLRSAKNLNGIFTENSASLYAVSTNCWVKARCSLIPMSLGKGTIQFDPYVFEDFVGLNDCNIMMYRSYEDL